MQVDAGRGRGRHKTRSMILPRIVFLFAFLSLAGAAFAAMGRLLVVVFWSRRGEVGPAPVPPAAAAG